MKVYLAGKINGVRDYHQIFAAAAERLRMQGHSVYNPAAANMEGVPLPAIMSRLLPKLCESDAIAMLPRWWTRFGGAWVEYLLARYLGLKVIYL